MGRPSINRYIGMEFKNRKSILKVVGVTEYLKKNKLILECSTCSKDEELYYYGSITSTYSSLSKGKIPCGCSNSTRTEKQNYILADRAAKKRGLVFLGWASSGYKKKKTFVRLYNPRLKYCWDTTVLQYLLSTDNLCCPETRRLGNRVKDEDYFLRKAKEVYPEGAKFERDTSGKIDANGRSMHWRVYCPVCDKDEYSLAGVSDGNFIVSSNSLRTGQLSCRCSGDRYHRNYAEYSYWINKHNKETGFYLDTSHYDSFNSREIVEYTCPQGHKCKSRLGLYLFNPTCNTCINTGFDVEKPSNFYIVRWYGYGESYLKFGITNREVIERISEQDKASKHLDYEILYMFYHYSGQAAWDCEKYLIKNMCTNVCPKNWLPDGYTETVEDTLDNIHKILETVSNHNLTRLEEIT